jgi:hypothetical protein
LAWHPATATLLIVEVKTALIDMQQMLGSLDVRTRLAHRIARERGWTAEQVATLLAIADTDAARGQVSRHTSLLASFSLRGRPARAWLSAPAGPARLLIYIPAAVTGRKTWRAGRQRVRRKEPAS